MTSITWAGPRCVQEAAAILGSQNRTQGRCELYLYNQTDDGVVSRYLLRNIYLNTFKRLHYNFSSELILFLTIIMFYRYLTL